MKRITPFLVPAFILVLSSLASGQFRDDFDGPALLLDPEAKKGWAFFSGDGSAVMDFLQGNGFASILAYEAHSLFSAIDIQISRDDDLCAFPGEKPGRDPPDS